MGGQRSLASWPVAPTRVRVPHHPRSVGSVRRWLRAELEAEGIARDVIDDGEIVMAELLGNAIRHAEPLPGSVVQVSWRVGDRVIDIEVTDGGSPAAVEPRCPTTTAVGGRGLHIVSSIARAWGVVDQADGSRRVWASLLSAVSLRNVS